MAYKFEDKFVRFRWNESLKGKKVFYADSISQLEEAVAKGEDIRVLIGVSETETYPFLIEGENSFVNVNWKFIYCDPNYEVKLAYEEGKTIQYKAIDTGNWCDWDSSLSRCPFHDDIEYRVKPEEDDDRKVLKWTDLNVGDIIELCSEEHCKAMVTEIDFADGWERHIHAGSHWIIDKELINWRKIKAV